MHWADHSCVVWQRTKERDRWIPFISSLYQSSNLTNYNYILLLPFRWDDLITHHNLKNHTNHWSKQDFRLLSLASLLSFPSISIQEMQRSDKMIISLGHTHYLDLHEIKDSKSTDNESKFMWTIQQIRV